MVGRDRRARHKGNFLNQFAFNPGAERRKQVRAGEGAIASAPGGRALPMITYLSFVFADAKIALHS